MEINHNRHRELEAAPTPPAAQVTTKLEWSCLPQAVGVGFLTFTCIMAIKRSSNDPWNVAFVVTSYLNLILLFLCLHIFEKTPKDSPRRGPLKVVLWSLSTLLTVIFSCKVAGFMPLVMKVVVWAMAGTSIGAVFFVFFIYKDNCCKVVDVDAAASKV